MKKRFLVLTLSVITALCSLVLVACGESAHVHVYEWTISKEATCTTDGKKTGVCSCGETTTQIIKAGHTEVVDQAVAPTCMETGLTEGKHCSVCNEILVVQEIIGKTDHIFIDGKCSVCGQKQASKGLSFTSNGDGTCTVTGIGACTDTDIIIPSVSTEGDTVTKIKSKAFYKCRDLTSVIIPDSVKSIGSFAFGGELNKSMGLTNVTIGNSVENIEESAFIFCRSLTNISIPDSVKSIGNYAFANCIGLESAIIGCNVASIGNYAFRYCSSLTNITVPDSVESIGNYVFEGCSSLTSVTIGNGVKSIGSHALYGCSKLTEIYYNGTETDWQAVNIGDNWKEYVPATEIHYAESENPGDEPEELDNSFYGTYRIYSVESDGETYYVGDTINGITITEDALNIVLETKDTYYVISDDSQTSSTYLQLICVTEGQEYALYIRDQKFMTLTVKENEIVGITAQDITPYTEVIFKKSDNDFLISDKVTKEEFIRASVELNEIMVCYDFDINVTLSLKNYYDSYNPDISIRVPDAFVKRDGRYVLTRSNYRENYIVISEDFKTYTEWLSPDSTNIHNEQEVSWIRVIVTTDTNSATELYDKLIYNESTNRYEYTDENGNFNYLIIKDGHIVYMYGKGEAVTSICKLYDWGNTEVVLPDYIVDSIL